MRHLILLFCLSAAAFGQPAISNITVAEKTSVCFQLRGQLSAGGQQGSIEWGPTTGLGNVSYERWIGNTSTSGWPIVCGVTPGSVVYFRPKAGASSTWSCVGDGTHTCDSGLGRITMLAAESMDPVAPSGLPSTAMPTVNGTTYNVTATSGCTNGTTGLQARIDAAASATNSLVHEVVIPAGSICTGPILLPAKAGTGWVIVRTDGNLPPEGVRLTDEYTTANLATIEIPLTSYVVGEYNNCINAKNTADTQGWRLVGIQCRPVSSLTPTEWNITDVDEATGVITVDTTGKPDAPTTFMHLAIAGVTGLTGQTPNTLGKAFFNSSTSFRLTPHHTGNLISSYTGTYAGGGKVIRTPGFTVTGATNASPIVVTTSSDHGLTDRRTFTISSVTTSVLTTSAAHDIGYSTSPYYDAAVVIEGSSVSAHNGVWAISANDSTTITLTGFPGTACAASCGTVRGAQLLSVQGVLGNTAANGSWVYSRVSATQVSLHGTTGNGAYTSGGILSYDPDYISFLATFESDSSRIIIDRCRFHSGGFPYRATTGIAFSCSDCAIVDSQIEVTNWRQAHPVAGVTIFGTDAAYVATSSTIDTTSGARKIIRNNSLRTYGIDVFVQEFASVRPTDYEISKNHFYANPAWRAGSAENIAQMPGLWFPRRHHLELKDGVRFKVDGNIFENGWQDFTGIGNAIAISPRQGKTVSDFDFTNNVLKSGATGFYGVGIDDVVTDPLTLVSKRVRLHNNIVLDLDHRKYRSSPAANGATNGGMFVLWAEGIQGLTISHNTITSMRGPIPSILLTSAGRAANIRIENNVIGDSTEGGYRSFINAAGYLNAGTPQPSGTVANGFVEMYPFSTVRNNVIVPLVDGTTLDANYSSSGSETYTQAECNSQHSSFTAFTCIGGTTALDRLAAMKWLCSSCFTDLDWRKFRLRHDSPAISGARLTTDGVDAGADVGKIEAATGRVIGARALSIATTTATIAFTAPDSTGCTVDWSTSSAFSSYTRVSNAGGARVQTVALTGLTTGTAYYARVNCAAEQPTVAFRTR